MKRLFFFSIIVLSVFMGLDWWKNRPKDVKKPKKKIIRPIEVGDASETVGTSEVGSMTASETSSATSEIASQVIEVASGTVAASGSGEIASPAEVVASAAAPANFDPWDIVDTHLFEKSIYSKMLEEAGKKMSSSGNAGSTFASRKKGFQILSAPFRGIFETDKELIALIGGEMKRVGGEWDGKTITNIGTDVITLEDASFVYRIPKEGLVISLNASEGTYSIVEDKIIKNFSGR